MLQHCTETCGWISGLIAAFAFGSFGVPIRSTSHLNIDPLVMQTYKSTMCFLTCWLVVLLGEPIRFTSWGIVSGIFWVPGATAGIYGIRTAGLAISAGTWSAIIVMTSFCWGIFIFEEEVKSVSAACVATLVLIIGLIGMSTYSEPPSKKEKMIMELTQPLVQKKDSELETIEECVSCEEEIQATSDTTVTKRWLNADSCDEGIQATSDTTVTKRRINAESPKFNRKLDIEEELAPFRLHDSDSSLNSDVEPRRDSTSKDKAGVVEHEELKKDADGVFCCYGIFISRRHLGIIGAIINGAWGGNSVVPMHYAKAQGFNGAGYLISYSCGSMLVTIALWVLRYLYNLYLTGGDTKQAYDSLPSSHLREMWLPGFLAGSLYSLGNFCALITISVLGQGVGYSFVQTSMLVSGLWGIFYFSEIQGTTVIAKWLLSSLVTVIGIMGLSFEHLAHIPDK